MSDPDSIALKGPELDLEPSGAANLAPGAPPQALECVPWNLWGPL